MQAETSHGPLAVPPGVRPVPPGARPVPPAGRLMRAGAPRWRALLEARWRARLQEVTELALAYHDAAAAAGHDTGGGHEARLRQRQLLRRTVASRRALADTEEALARLSSGKYGWCECCAGAIPADRLSAAPETRYCARCAQEPRPQVPAAVYPRP
jgi:RNA polymerase-binding transcription factor DksA